MGRSRRAAPMVAAAVSLAVLGALALAVHEGRATAHQRNRSAVEHQERQLSHALPPRQPSPAAPTTDLCVTGVDTFATAIAGTLPAPPPTKGKTSAPLLAPSSSRHALIAHISQAAVRAERFAENAHPAPTLPQRMGSRELAGQRAAIEPLASFCQGRAYAATPLEPIVVE